MIGTGTIGMSWTALFLARGLAVGASDPAPEAETRLRRFVDGCLAGPGAAGSGGSRRRRRIVLTFHPQPEAAASGAEFVQENAPGARERQTGAAGAHRRGAAAGNRHRVEFVGAADQPPASRRAGIPSGSCSAIRSTRRT